MTRLETRNRGLYRAFVSATTEQRRKAAAVACSFSAHTVGLTGSEVLRALDWIDAERGPDAELAKAMAQLCERLDEEYFRLGEQGDSSASPRLFSLARSAAALAIALEDQPVELLHESIYESISSVGDASGLENIVEDALTS